MKVVSLPAPLLVRPCPEPERDDSGAIIYPESDGLPMAWTTIHYDGLTFLKDGFENYFVDRPDVFIAGDLFWYPLEGHPEIVVAPDVLVVFGRPKGFRRSYKQWEEGGIAPQVVFEILSHRTTGLELMHKMEFYSRYGVAEYYIFDPESRILQIWQREGAALKPVPDTQGYQSPLLGVTFWLTEDGALHVVFPDGTRMLSHAEQAQLATEEKQRAQQEKQRAEQEKQRAEQEKQRADKLAERLRALGVDPNA